MSNETKVVITAIKIPFVSLVLFMVKVGVAAIPTYLILTVVATALQGLAA